MNVNKKIIIPIVIVIAIIASVIGIALTSGQTNDATSNSTSSSNTETIAQTSLASTSKTNVVITGKQINLDNYQASTAFIIESAGVYTISGTIADGIIEVNVADTAKVELVLNNASITNSDWPAIYTANADSTVITLADGTQNTVADGSKYSNLDASGNPDAAIFSHDDLVFKGNGSLSITGRYQDAIGGNDDVKISGGNYTINAADDAIHCGNDLVITGGNIDIQSSYEGIEGVLVNISGGNIKIVSSDDGINGAGGTSTTAGTTTTPTAPGQGTAPRGGGGMSSTTGEVIISGGNISIAAGGSGSGDGIDVNGNLTIAGGDIVIKDPARYMDYEPLDFDGTFSFTSGRVQRLSASGVYTEITSSYTGSMGGGARR